MLLEIFFISVVKASSRGMLGMQMTAHDIEKADNLDHTDNHDEFVGFIDV